MRVLGAAYYHGEAENAHSGRSIATSFRTTGLLKRQHAATIDVNTRRLSISTSNRSLILAEHKSGPGIFQKVPPQNYTNKALRKSTIQSLLKNDMCIRNEHPLYYPLKTTDAFVFLERIESTFEKFFGVFLRARWAEWKYRCRETTGVSKAFFYKFVSNFVCTKSSNIDEWVFINTI